MSKIGVKPIIFLVTAQLNCGTGIIDLMIPILTEKGERASCRWWLWYGAQHNFMHLLEMLALFGPPWRNLTLPAE